MHDLRHDPNAHAADPRETTQYDLLTVTLPARRIDPAQLRTVPMPNLRSPRAREMDAAARDLRTGPEHTGDELAMLHGEIAVLREAIERLADAVTVLMLERDMRREQEESIKIRATLPASDPALAPPFIVTSGPVTTIKGPVSAVDANGQEWKQRGNVRQSYKRGLLWAYSLALCWAGLQASKLAIGYG